MDTRLYIKTKAEKKERRVGKLTAGKTEEVKLA